MPSSYATRMVHDGPRARGILAAAALVSALAIFGLAYAAEERYGEALLFLFVIPLTLGVGAWGLRGGLAVGLLCGLLATTWWAMHGQPEGTAWAVSRSAACLAIGLILGWFLDATRRLSRDLAHHQEFSLDLIVTASFEGYFTRVSPSVTRLLGYTREEFLEQPFLDFVHPDDLEATLGAVAAQVGGEEILSFQNRYRRKDGSYRWLEWTSRPDLDQREMLAVARDITDRKRLEEREHAYQQSLESAVRDRTLELELSSTELEKSHHETLSRLALAAEFRDDETQAHTYRVADTAARIAREMGLDIATVKLIGEAALLHDVGKVGIPDAILFKDGPLSADEFDVVKSHALIGRSILANSSSEILRAAEEIAGSHHEWWDGTGYPEGLVGGEIPLDARIVALADVFDALMHRRPYKPPWPLESALDEIRSLRGRQFSPDVVDAFLRLDHREIVESWDAMGAGSSVRERPHAHSPNGTGH